MHLSEDQIDRMLDTMGALLVYVNDRFGVVESFDDPFATYEEQAKASVVMRTLWDNVEVIDDFAAKNPFDLSADCLAAAVGWKDALRGPFVFVRHSHGHALLMNEAGVFAVRGIGEDLSEILLDAPDRVSTVLLPFEGGIVYDGWLSGFGEPFTPDECRTVQDEFEAACAKGIVWTSDAFCERSREFNARLRDRELDALLMQAQREAARDAADEALPEGFHRGVLAGLAAGERTAAIEARMGQAHSVAGGVALDVLKEAAIPCEPPASWEECLRLLPEDELGSLARDCGVEGGSSLDAAGLSRAIAASAGRSEFLEEALRAGNPDAFKAMRDMAASGRIEFSADSQSAHAHAFVANAPLPFSFLFLREARFVAVMPDEVRSLCAGIDFAAIARMREKDEAAFRCADACAIFYGVIALDDAYDRYREVCLDCLDKAEFCSLVWEEALWGGSEFCAWKCGGLHYLIHYSLQDDFVASQFSEMHQRDMAERLSAAWRSGEGQRAVSAVFESFQKTLDAELQRLERLRVDLSDMHVDIAPRPLDMEVAHEDAMDVLLSRPQMARLRDFLDAHVPDGEDDYLFADRVTEDIASIAIEDGDYRGALDYLARLGFDGCAEGEGTLARLAKNACEAMPSWENNGWSPREWLERITGRKTFFDEQGNAINVGRNDPCPCGSGKQYRHCCGR